MSIGGGAFILGVLFVLWALYRKSLGADVF